MQVTLEASEEKEIRLTVLTGRDIPVGTLILAYGIAFVTTSEIFGREWGPDEQYEIVTLHACAVPFQRAIGVSSK